MIVNPELLANKYVVIEGEKKLSAVLYWLSNVLTVHHGRSLGMSLIIDMNRNPGNKCYIQFNYDGSGVEIVPHDKFLKDKVGEKYLELKLGFTETLVVSEANIAAPTVCIDGKIYLLDDVLSLLSKAGTSPISC